MKNLFLSRYMLMALTVLILGTSSKFLVITRPAKCALKPEATKSSNKSYCHCQELKSSTWCCCWNGGPNDPDCNQVSSCSECK